MSNSKKLIQAYLFETDLMHLLALLPRIEAAPKQFFTTERQATLVALALVTPSCLIPG